MRLKTIREAQTELPDLVHQAREETIGLTDDDGNLVGLLAGIDEDEVDDLLVETPGFKAMIARSRASLARGKAIPAEDLLEEFRVKQAEEDGSGPPRQPSP